MDGFIYVKAIMSPKKDMSCLLQAASEIIIHWTSEVRKTKSTLK